jgi:hypothetical protein
MTREFHYFWLLASDTNCFNRDTGIPAMKSIGEIS